MEEKKITDVKGAIDNAERIGVIGSPSSTSNITVDILGTAVDKKLVGNLCIFGYPQENKSNYALGQVVEVKMKNVWSEDPTMRGLIRQRGSVPPITGRQDTHIAKLITSAVFSVDGNIEPSMLGTVPCTGTNVKLMDEKIMNSLFSTCQNELFYLGNAYGTTIKMPMWFKHFGKGNLGVGEAYHIGVFGKTGSGKSVLAEMIMLGYAKHKEMSIFVLDPQGQFSRDLETNPIIKKVCDDLEKEVKIFHLNNLVLDDPNLFVRVLAKSKFWEGLVRSDEYRIRAGEILWEFLFKRQKSKISDFTEAKVEINIFNLHKKEVFEKVFDILKSESFQNRVYSKQYAQELKRTIESGTLEQYYERWLPVAKLFTWDGRGEKAIVINKLVKEEVFVKEKVKRRPIIVIDLSKESISSDMLWNEEIQTLTIKRILDKLTEVAEEHYKNNELLNSLVIIDEAHRFAPRERLEEGSLNEVKQSLIDAIRTTRKYGLGWMFISQTLSSLDRNIINQIRVYIFGFGLGWGIEREALRELIGGAEESIRLYQLFRDPQSSLGKKEYPFMTIGPISPLSFAGTPLFFNALTFPTEFLEINFT